MPEASIAGSTLRFNRQAIFVGGFGCPHLLRKYRLVKFDGLVKSRHPGPSPAMLWRVEESRGPVQHAAQAPALRVISF